MFSIIIMVNITRARLNGRFTFFIEYNNRGLSNRNILTIGLSARNGEQLDFGNIESTDTGKVKSSN